MPDRNPRRCRCARRPPRTYCTEETSNLLQRLRAASERDHWQLLDQAPSVRVSIVVLPAQQPAEAVADNRGDEPVSLLVIPDHLQGFRQIWKTGTCRKTAPSYGDFNPRLRLDIEKPIGIPAETSNHEHFRDFLPVLHDLEHGFPLPPATPAGVLEQQDAATEQAAQSPTVQIYRGPEKIPAKTFFLDRTHEDSTNSRHGINNVALRR